MLRDFGKGEKQLPKKDMTGITEYKPKKGKAVYRVRYSHNGEDRRIKGTFDTIAKAQEARAEAIKVAKRKNPSTKDIKTVGQLIEKYSTIQLRNLSWNTRYTREGFFKNHI